MRAAIDPWSVRGLAKAAGASPNYAKHYVAVLRKSGHVELVEPATQLAGEGGPRPVIDWRGTPAQGRHNGWG